MLSVIPDFEHLQDSVELASRLDAAFEYNDFFLPKVLCDEELFQKRIEGYLAVDRDRSCDTLHGAFFDIVINSSDPEIKDCSIRRVRKSMEAARLLGCRAVIFHTNYLTGFKSYSYRDKWVRDHAAFYRTLCAEYPEIDVLIENMFDDTPELLGRLCDVLSDVKNFGVCFDVAHANLWELPLSGWIDRLIPFIRHLHVNDNFGDEDSHLAVGEGSLDWNILNCPAFKVSRPSVLIEVNGNDRILRSYHFLKERSLYPFT